MLKKSVMEMKKASAMKMKMKKSMAKLKKASATKMGHKSPAKLMGGAVAKGLKAVSLQKKKKDAYREYVKKSNKNPKKFPPVSSDKFRKSMLKK